MTREAGEVLPPHDGHEVLVALRPPGVRRAHHDHRRHAQRLGDVARAGVGGQQQRAAREQRLRLRPARGGVVRGDGPRGQPRGHLGGERLLARTAEDEAAEPRLPRDPRDGVGEAPRRVDLRRAEGRARAHAEERPRGARAREPRRREPLALGRHDESRGAAVGHGAEDGREAVVALAHRLGVEAVVAPRGCARPCVRRNPRPRRA